MLPLTSDRLYLLVKDPRWAFAGWELTAATRERLAREPGRLILRVHDVTDILFDGGNSHHSFAVEVSGPTDHWYLDLPLPGRVYLAELGFAMAGGGFELLSRSRPAATPRTAPEAGEERWTTIEV